MLAKAFNTNLFACFHNVAVSLSQVSSCPPFKYTGTTINKYFHCKKSKPNVPLNTGYPFNQRILRTGVAVTRHRIQQDAFDNPRKLEMRNRYTFPLILLELPAMREHLDVAAFFFMSIKCAPVPSFSECMQKAKASH